jgi:hypothetical protein
MTIPDKDLLATADPSTLPPPPAWLQTPPTNRVTPPVKTRAQELPFGSLAWEDFERLCLRLASREARVEHCQRYGVRGQEQEGIDLYARLSFGSKYRVYQCKRERTFGPANIKTAVQKFLNGGWVEKTEMFVLCTEKSLEPTALADELERQTVALRERGVTLLPWDTPRLSVALKQLPELVDDFFGREWVREFCGEEQAEQLGDRLDATAMVEFRQEMGRLYVHVFNNQDPGFLIADTPGVVVRLEDRYVVPDVLDRRSVRLSGVTPGAARDGRQGIADRTSHSGQDVFTADRDQGLIATVEGRRAVGDWVAANDRMIILGGPGSGKSTLLRFLAIDLLSESPRLDSVAKKWGAYLPVWVPFPLWTKLIAEAGPAISLTEISRRWLVGWDEGRLWPLVERALKDRRLLLLVDGLDEWTNAEAAAVALDRLRVFVDQRSIPAIMASRPHGFRRLGLEHAGWAVGELAGFTPAQQKNLAQIWYAHCIAHLGRDSSDRAEVDRKAAASSEELLEELAASPDFQELAKVPLLLCLLIIQRMHDGYLPTNRFKAYDQLVDLLTAKHPARRRKAAEIPNTVSPALSDEETKQVLASLAYHIQTHSPEGLMDSDEARTTLRQYLRDPDWGFDFAEREAQTLASRLLDVGVEATGILVSRSQSEIGFFHRSAQEYLAACHLAGLPLAEQVRVMKARYSDPLWSEVLLCLIHLTRRPADVQTLANAIQAECRHPVDRMAADLLLAEVVFGGFHCPNALARDITYATFEQIETGTWLPFRERLLQRILDGLRSAKARGTIEAKVPEWFPSRLHWRPFIFRAMEGWTSDPCILHCLERALPDEDTGVQRSAAHSLARIAEGDPVIGSRVADAARHADDPHARAAAVEALSLGWPDHVELPEILEIAGQSIAPTLQLAAIAAKVRIGMQTENDREKLMRLGSWSPAVDVNWQQEVPASLLRGWPRSESIKRACLNAVRDSWPRDRRIELEFAHRILLQGYPGDADVAASCAEELRSEHPFVTLDLFAWDLIAKGFQGFPEIITAAEACAARQPHWEPQIAMLALVGRTDAMKRRLLDQLNSSSIPHWATGSLLDGWGMEDGEVASRLREVANGPADRASRIATYFPRIIADRIACRARLLSILKDPTCHRPDFVLDGLEQLGTRDDVEAMDTILALLPARPVWRTIPMFEVIGRIIQYYAWESRARDLAKQELAHPAGSHISVVRVFGNDAEIRREILRYANPLPTALRAQIAKGLRPGAGSDDFLVSTLRMYDHESDAEVKTEASIAYHRAVRTLGRVTATDLDSLCEAIVGTGPDDERRRQAAFAGLVALGQIRIFETARDWQGVRPGLPLHALAAPNLTLIRFVLQNWGEARPVFAEVLERDDGSLWDTLCSLADDYPLPCDEALRFFERREDVPPRSNELRFLARARPGSMLVLSRCMRALGIGESTVGVIGPDAIAAAEILGAQFSRDDEVRGRIAAECQGSRVNGAAILALCEVWPESPVVARAYNPEILRGPHDAFTFAFALRLACLQGTAGEIEGVIERLLNDFQGVRSPDLMVPPIVRRLGSDDLLFTNLAARLFADPSPSQKASYPRLLKSARGMSPELREWAHAEIARQVGVRGLSEIGMDLVSGTHRAVWHSLMEMIG